MDIKRGDLIQIKPDAGNIDLCWQCCILIVDEVNTHGVLAYLEAPVPGMPKEASVQYYLRLSWDQFEHCADGRAKHLIRA